MDVRELCRIAVEVCRRSGLLARQDPPLTEGKVPGDAFHLGRRFRQLRILLAGRGAVAHQKQPPNAFPLRGECRSQYMQGTCVRDRSVFNPVMQFRFGDNQRLEVQVVQAAIGDDENLRVLRQDGLRGRDQRAISLVVCDVIAQR